MNCRLCNEVSSGASDVLLSDTSTYAAIALSRAPVCAACREQHQLSAVALRCDNCGTEGRLSPVKVPVALAGEQVLESTWKLCASCAANPPKSPGRPRRRARSSE